MSVESDIYDLLKSLVGNRVFPDAAPFDTVRPYIVYTQVGGQPISYIDNTLPDSKHGQFQVDVWAASRSDAASLNKSIEAAFIGATTFTSRPASGPMSRHEPDLGLFGASQDFDIWSVR